MNKRRKLSKMNVKKQHLAYGAITLVALFSCILAVTVIFKSSQVTTESLSKADKVRVAKKSKMNKATSKSKVEGVKQAPKPSSQSTEANSQQQVTASEEAAVEQAVVTENTPATSQAQQAYAVTETTYRPAQHQPSGQVLSNGNTAGAIGSAAAQMAAATGVPQSTWEHIIARESNGNPNVANASGASGLFQTMPGWGSTATVQDQVNSAIKAYRAQGLSAWGY
ncbi:TPA: transglycosylase SLT domain-containing protein [Streptococcus agalactiae]|uniref:Transglycosylase n=1 Tax=Streptococcus agalactiae TaxID=1311 RepID=A0A853P1R7_STRAG|nr:transglycosylase SLT domain-containing protein [Streptococcus agalactiae]KAA8985762.1 transglycosylase SLT domain-containing protein [Streptococcus agalactiae]KLL26422.1 transglycosylase [Streptococcus agalactiae]KLL46330.1 transglycosylase [Streptococcus agalactiae]OCM70495.1 transglycosylase [Streptococcus agalactiae]OCM77497.1 transglycosylase [Streptococcus agalactiae]